MEHTQTFQVTKSKPIAHMAYRFFSMNEANMSEFPPNSHKKQAEGNEVEPRARRTGPEVKKVEKITTSEVIRRKKPLGKRFMSHFFGHDAKSAWSYAVLDVMMPAAKDMLADSVSQGVERMIFPNSEHGRSTRRNRGSGSRYTPYNNFSSNGRREPEPRQQLSRRGRANHDFDEIILGSRVEAEEVLDKLFELVSKYDSATVTDLYEMIGVSGNYTDDKWGWTDIRGAQVVRIRDGYVLELPKPEPLD